MYSEIVPRLWDAVRRKRPRKLARDGWFIEHDNAPVHWSLVAKKKKVPYQARYDGFGASAIVCGLLLKGPRFSSAEQVTATATRALSEVSKNCFLE
jgi:hypothetical protein